MARLRFKLDENLPRDAVTLLEQAGHDVDTVPNQNLAGHPDAEVLQACQEYFVPYDKMAEFVDGLRTIVQRNGANLLNVTIRVVHKDDVTAVPYAKQDAFGLVLYFNQGFNETESLVLERTTRDLIDVVLGVNGTYYLPYQLFYSPEQLRHAYPEIDGCFAAKRKYDPLGLLTNKLYDKYGT